MHSGKNKNYEVCLYIQELELTRNSVLNLTSSKMSGLVVGSNMPQSL